MPKLQCWLKAAVVCDQTGTIYDSVALASRDLNVNQKSVHYNLYGRNKAGASGLTFHYAYDHLLNAKGKRDE